MARYTQIAQKASYAGLSEAVGGRLRGRRIHLIERRRIFFTDGCPKCQKGRGVRGDSANPREVYLTCVTKWGHLLGATTTFGDKRIV